MMATHFSLAPANSGAMPSTVGDLMRNNDELFIQRAYLALLGRAADPHGLEVYTAQLRDGAQKIALIDQLRRSAEGRMRETRLHGLERSLRLYRMGRIPIFGWIIRWVNKQEGDSPIERRLRSIAIDIHRLSYERQGSASSTPPSEVPSYQPPGEAAGSLQQALLWSITTKSLMRSQSENLPNT